MENRQVQKKETTCNCALSAISKFVAFLTMIWSNRMFSDTGTFGLYTLHIYNTMSCLYPFLTRYPPYLHASIKGVVTSCSMSSNHFLLVNSGWSNKILTASSLSLVLKATNSNLWMSSIPCMKRRMEYSDWDVLALFHLASLQLVPFNLP